MASTLSQFTIKSLYNSPSFLLRKIYFEKALTEWSKVVVKFMIPWWKLMTWQLYPNWLSLSLYTVINGWTQAINCYSKNVKPLKTLLCGPKSILLFIENTFISFLKKILF